MIDKRFGRLVVKSFYDVYKQNKRWLCKCDCGNTKIARTGDLNYRETNSCGCLKSESSKKLGVTIGIKNLKKGPLALWKGHGEIPHSYWTHLRNGAKSRHITFEIEIKHAWRLFLRQKRLCALSGRGIGFKTLGVNRSSSKNTASLDRINSKKGYIKGNVQWLHKDINRLKNNYSQSNFIAMCREVAKNQDQKLANRKMATIMK